MTPAERDLRYYTALGLAAEASHLALGYFSRRETLGTTMKGAQDWLTVADGKVEAFLRERLSQLFPQDTVIGEEGGGEASDAVWILDPIDGTANFAHGDRNWCVSIGFVLICVVLYAGTFNLNDIVLAQKGRGRREGLTRRVEVEARGTAGNDDEIRCVDSRAKHRPESCRGVDDHEVGLLLQHVAHPLRARPTRDEFRLHLEAEPAWGRPCHG